MNQQLSISEIAVPFARRRYAAIIMRENSSRLRIPDGSEYEAFRAAPLIAFRETPRGVLPVAAKIAMVAALTFVFSAAFWLLMSYVRLH
jgi:hypothetical protein